MKTTIKHWSIAILFLSSLLISIPNMQAIPVQHLEQHIETTIDSRKNIRKAQRKLKRAERQKKRIGKGLRVLLIVFLVTLSVSLFMAVIGLAIISLFSGGGSVFTIPLFLCAIALGGCIWGIVALIKAGKSSKTPRVKNSL